MNNIKLKNLFKNTIKFNSDIEFKECMILSMDKGHYFSQICTKYLEYYERSKRLTIVETKYHELLDEFNEIKK